MQTHEDFMRIAITLSEENVISGNGGPFGAVLVKEGEIIAQSANQVVPQNDPTAHAEISAIRLACRKLETFNLKDCTIYTSCEPCPMCLAAIYWAHIDTVYYANTKTDAASINFDDNFIYEELTKDMKERKLLCIQILRQEALPAFRLWQQSSLKRNYN